MNMLFEIVLTTNAKGLFLRIVLLNYPVNISKTYEINDEIYDDTSFAFVNG